MVSVGVPAPAAWVSGVSPEPSGIIRKSCGPLLVAVSVTIGTTICPLPVPPLELELLELELELVELELVELELLELELVELELELELLELELELVELELEVVEPPPAPVDASVLSPPPQEVVAETSARVDSATKNRESPMGLLVKKRIAYVFTRRRVSRGPGALAGEVPLAARESSALALWRLPR